MTKDDFVYSWSSGILFSLLACFIGLCWWRVSLLADLRESLPVFYPYFVSVFILYLVSLFVIHRISGTNSTNHQRFTIPLIIILIAAVIFRLTLLGGTPSLSDDIYRYLWDGRVQLAGINPYTYAPNDPALAFLSNEQASFINFPHLRTVYPPISQFAFWLGVSITQTLTAQKFIFVCTEVITIIALLIILRCRRINPLWVLAYAWHPLVVLEISGSGHNDSLGIAFLWMGIAAWQLSRYGSSALSFAAAFLSKFGSLIMIPWWWFRKKAYVWLFIFTALCVIPLLLHIQIVTNIGESFSGVATVRMDANSSLYFILTGLLNNAMLTKIVVLVFTGLFLIWWARREADPVRYLLGAFSVVALLTPVLHPWYLLWVIPCFCFVRFIPMIILTGTVVLAYTIWPAYASTGVWSMPLWARLLEYLPVMILGIWEAKRALSKRNLARSNAQTDLIAEA